MKGGGAEDKYVHVRKFHPWPWRIKGYAKLGGGKLEIKVNHSCTQGVLGKGVFLPRGSRKKNSVNYINCIRTIDCLCSKSTSRPAL